MGIGNIGWTEFLVILAIALIFFGPRRLPGIAQTIGKSLREFQKALNEVKSEIAQAGREADTRSEITRIPPGPVATAHPEAPPSPPDVTREAEVVVEEETADQEEQTEVRVTPEAPPPDSPAGPSPQLAAEDGSGTNDAEVEDADSRDSNRP